MDLLLERIRKHNAFAARHATLRDLRQQILHGQRLATNLTLEIGLAI